jgi:glycine hydroxymethyltransferase
MDEVEKRAIAHKPRLIIAGGSSYPRVIDFAAFGAIANAVGARLLVDMAHIAGLVAGRAHPSPVPHADVVTTTTTKTLRGARGGLIVSNNEDLGKRIDSSLFPGVQGSAHLQIMAGKVVCLGEALRPEFRDYAAAVVAHAKIMAATLLERGYDVITGGTDTHLLLLDLRRQGLKGNAACDRLEVAGITSNKNAVPFDEEKPWVTSGLRLASSSATTRGLGPDEFRLITALIADVLDEMAAGGGRDGPAVTATRAAVSEICAQFPIYPII